MKITELQEMLEFASSEGYADLKIYLDPTTTFSKKYELTEVRVIYNDGAYFQTIPVKKI